VRTTSLRSVHVVVPDDIDDAAVPSGGNAYDRRACLGLADAGCAVHELPVAGGWPRPDAAARESLARTLATLPDGAVVLIDGLVACGVPDVVVPQAGRLRLVVLVHLPLGDEVGASPSAAAELAALERESLHAASAVVATSSWVARRLVATHALDPERIHVATPGADPAPPATGTDGASRLLCVGSVTPTKGQDLLVEALAEVADLPWSCDLTGPLSRNPVHVASVRSTIERHGLGERVRLTGPQTGERLEAAYQTRRRRCVYESYSSYTAAPQVHGTAVASHRFMSAEKGSLQPANPQSHDSVCCLAQRNARRRYIPRDTAAAASRHPGTIA